jgi:predicted PurR-regulated permease PerM
MYLESIIIFVLVFIVVVVVIWAYCILSNLHRQIKHLEHEHRNRQDYIRELQVENEKTVQMLKNIGSSLQINNNKHPNKID